MSQIILLGLGGTGMRVVDKTTAKLRRKGLPFNDGNICCVVLDTNKNDVGKIENVPTVRTSDRATVGELRRYYSYKGVNSWLPESASFNAESIVDGAGQMRPKSRLAFANLRWKGDIAKLETYINRLFVNQDVDSKIRVMIVSSLAGGTGSGMFIQTALWLQKFFKERGNCQATIRGVFLLPDVFIRTIEDIRKDPTEKQSLYANAYGSIRELNTITKIKRYNYKPKTCIQVDDLFSSDAPADGKPVFDYAFFIDDIAENGVAHDKIDQYESIVAEQIYMQLFAPMSTDLYSEEDNLFKRFDRSPEPVFGSCGTAKAVYPTESILEYCALMALRDSIKNGWTNIDSEIQRRQNDIRRQEARGIFLDKRIDPRSEFMRIYEDKIALNGVHAGSDRLFVNIAHDHLHEEGEPDPENPGELRITYIDRVDTLTENIETLISDTIKTSHLGNLSSIALAQNWALTNKDDKSKLASLIGRKQRQVKRALDEIDAGAEAIAASLTERLLTCSMGSVNAANDESIYGLMTKRDETGSIRYVHPLAVRYMLYKLYKWLGEVTAENSLARPRSDALKGCSDADGQKVDWDIPQTNAVEETPEQYLNARVFLRRESTHLAKFREMYAEFISIQVALCNKYAIKAVKLKTAQMLSERLEALIKELEAFFYRFDQIGKKIDDSIRDNIKKTSVGTLNTLYICGDEESKRGLYDSLYFDGINDSASDLNEILLNTIYGAFCAHILPDDSTNAAYCRTDILKAFIDIATASYSKEISNSNHDAIFLDIYQAILKDSDVTHDKQLNAIRSKNPDMYIPPETADQEALRHHTTLTDIVERIRQLASPMMISDNEQPEDSDEHLVPGDAFDEDFFDNEFRPIRKRKTFWGIHPKIAENYPDISTILGVNVDSQKNFAYDINELTCYRAVYGVLAKYMPKLNESHGGIYYRNYASAVRSMVNGVSSGNNATLVHTPHMDKTWHLVLPYVTPEKQTEVERRFFSNFWKAIAYSMITLSKDGLYQVKRSKKARNGSYQTVENILHNGRSIGKVDIDKLIEALINDAQFERDAARLDSKYAADCAAANYVTTELYAGKEISTGSSGTFDVTAFAGISGESAADITKKLEEQQKTTKDPKSAVRVGGLATTGELNAVTMIVRYSNCPDHSEESAADMVFSLQELLKGLVEPKYAEGEDDKVMAVVYRLCQGIYMNSSLKDKDIPLFEVWKENWS